MEGSYLHEAWSAPDNTRLVSKQFSFRLPVHVAAKLAAIGEMYPTKSRTQIVADLLTLALDNFEKELPAIKGDVVDPEVSEHLGEEYGYSIEGTRRTFWQLSNKYFQELEEELGNAEIKPLFNLNAAAPDDYFSKKA